MPKSGVGSVVDIGGENFCASHGAGDWPVMQAEKASPHTSGGERTAPCGAKSGTETPISSSCRWRDSQSAHRWVIPEQQVWMSVS